MEILHLFNPLLLLASLFTFSITWWIGIRKTKYGALKALGVFWIIIIVQLLISVVELYIEIHSDEMGYPDVILRPIGTMLYSSIYACSLTSVVTIFLSVTKFKKNEVWIEFVLVLTSISTIIISSSILYLINNLMK